MPSYRDVVETCAKAFCRWLCACLDDVTTPSFTLSRAAAVKRMSGDRSAAG